MMNSVQLDPAMYGALHAQAVSLKARREGIMEILKDKPNSSLENLRQEAYLLDVQIKAIEKEMVRVANDA